MDDMPQDIQEFFNVSEEMNKNLNNNGNEAYDYFVLYHSNGWKRLEEYAISIKEALEYSSKQKLPEESLESYAAKRMSADSTISFIDNMLNQVKVSSESYDQNKK
jgi:hypothetical protein